MNTWTHAELGEFESDDCRWIQEEFYFKSLEKVFPKSDTTLELTIEIDETDYEDLGDDDPLPAPTDEIIALTVKVVSSLPELISQGVEALWKDIHGTGISSSGMWWNNALDEVFASDFGPAKPDDVKGLYALLEPTGVGVDASIYKWKGPAARITFSSEIDEEHGISFLTDGEQIIGLGYTMDPSPFDHLCVS